MFNKGKLREQEAADKIKALQNDLEKSKQRIDVLTETLISLLDILPEAEIRAREIIVTAIPKSARTEQLPQVHVGITVVSNFRPNVPVELSEENLKSAIYKLCDSLPLALGKSARSPSVENISRVVKPSWPRIPTSPITYEINVVTPYHAELEVVTVDLDRLLADVFKNFQPNIRLASMKKAAQPEIKFWVENTI